MKYAFIGTYPPREYGIGTFTGISSQEQKQLISMTTAVFHKIRQLYAKTGITKNRTSLLSDSSVFIVRSVADGFSQFSLFLFTFNHVSYKELQAFSTQVKVSKPNQKQILYANCLPA